MSIPPSSRPNGMMRIVAPYESWWCGPPLNPRAYEVTDIDALRGGSDAVVRAIRRQAADDPIRYEGPVALKVYSRFNGEVGLAIERLNLIRQIVHPNLARQIEAFTGPALARDPDVADGDDVFYVASAWEEGAPLSVVAPINLRAVAQLIDGVAAAVQSFHDNGLLHRDLHPGNVIVRPDGSGAVIDFGTARPDDGAFTATVAGVIGFIPPDAVAGGASRAGDRWSIGMLAVYALLGHPQGTTSRKDLELELRAALALEVCRKQTVQALLAMIDPDPTRRPDDLRVWTKRLSGDTRRMRIGIVAAALAMAIVLGAVVGYLFLFGESDKAEYLPTSSLRDAETVSAESIQLPTRLDTEPSTTASPETASGTDDGRQPVLPDGVTGVVGCAPSGAPEPSEYAAPEGSCWSGGFEPVLEGRARFVIGRDGENLGVVVDRPSGDSVYLNQVVWQSYQEIAGRGQPNSSAQFGGYPVAVEYRSDPDAIVVRLDAGGLLVGPRDDTQLFWIHPAGVEVWQQEGGLGGPLGFPAANLRINSEGAFLEFAGGMLSVAPELVGAVQAGETVPIQVTMIDDPDEVFGGVLPRSVIIRQWNGVAWWIDASGFRHWISDGSVWNCLGGDDAVAADDLPGWAVWVFPLAEPVDC